MRVRTVVFVIVVILVVAAVGLGVWRPWRDAEPAPGDTSASVDTNANVTAPPTATTPAPPAAVPPAPATGAVPAPGPSLPIARLPAHDAGVGAPDAGDRARFRSLHQAMATATPDAARLHAHFLRMRIAAPAETKTLLEMKQRGVPHDQLVAYVKENFHDLAARAIALRWLGVGSAPVGAAPQPPAGQPAPVPTPATGTLTRNDGG